MNGPVGTQWLTRYVFNVYCKRAPKNEAANGHREIKRRKLTDVTLSDLTPVSSSQFQCIVNL